MRTNKNFTKTNIRWWIQSISSRVSTLSSSFDMNNYMWPKFFFDKVKLFIKRVFCTMVKRVIITQDFFARFFDWFFSNLKPSFEQTAVFSYNDPSSIHSTCVWPQSSLIWVICWKLMWKLSCAWEIAVSLENYFSPHLSALDFCNSLVSNMYQVWWTGFFPSLNWIFLPTVACKIQV